MSFNVVILASGTGSLFEALLHNQSNFRVSALVTDNPTSEAIRRAEEFGVSVHICELSNFDSRTSWDDALLATLQQLKPDFVVSAGFMKVLGASVVEEFEGRLINIHPSLLPDFPGAHAVNDALSRGVKKTGTTVHFIDRGVDTGPIIAQREVEIRHDDSVESLHERIKDVERKLIVDVVTEFAKKASQ